MIEPNPVGCSFLVCSLKRPVCGPITLVKDRLVLESKLRIEVYEKLNGVPVSSPSVYLLHCPIRSSWRVPLQPSFGCGFWVSSISHQYQRILLLAQNPQPTSQICPFCSYFTVCPLLAFSLFPRHLRSQPPERNAALPLSFSKIRAPPRVPMSSLP